MSQLTAKNDVVMEISYHNFRHLTVFFSGKAVQAKFRDTLEEFCKTQNIDCLTGAAKLQSTMEMIYNENIYKIEQIRTEIEKLAESKELSFTCIQSTTFSR